MQIPAAMFIESGADSLKTLNDWERADQIKELRSFGDERAKQIGASGITDDFSIGYQLGLQTARVVIAGSTALLLKGVDPRDVL